MDREEILRLGREFGLPLDTALRKMEREDRLLEELDAILVEAHESAADEGDDDGQ